MYFKFIKQFKFVNYVFREFSNLSYEYVYGIQPVFCVFKFKNRDLYKLYMQRDLFNTEKVSDLKAPYILDILKAADDMNISVVPVETSDLNKMVNFRAHQGVVLQASPTFIRSINNDLVLNYLDFEDSSICNLYNEKNKRFKRPIILLLECLTDILNFGCILRSAVFFGVYAIIISTPCASPSPLVSKLSVGAMECLKFYRLTYPDMDLKLLSDAGFVIIGTSGNSALSLDLITEKDLLMFQLDKV